MGMLDDFRTKNPAYKDTPDDKLSDGLYNKFYASKMSRDDFNKKTGFYSPAQEPTKPEQSTASQLFQGAGNLANKFTENVLEPAGKAISNIVPESYRKAAQPMAEGIASGINKAADINTQYSSKVPGLENYQKAVETAKYAMLNPDKTQHPEAMRNVKAAWDLIQAGGGVKGMAEAGLLAGRGAMAAGKLASKGTSAVGKTALETAAPEYAAKRAEMSRVNALPVSDKLKESRNKQYAVADNSGTKYHPELNNEFIKKVESKIENPRGENKPGLSDEELEEMKALQSAKKLTKSGKEALSDLEKRSKETGLSSSQERKNKIYNEYVKLYKENPITSFSGLRSLERELTDKISKEINPATHKVSETGQALLDVRTHLHDMYLNPEGKYLKGAPEGVKAHLNANKTYSQEIKAKQLEEAKMIGGGDANAERNEYRSLYKKALKQRQFWSDKELEELHTLGKKPTVLGKMVGGVIAHKTMGLSKLLPESAIDTSKIENLLLQGK